MCYDKAVKQKAPKKSPELSLHLRLSRELLDRLLKKRDAMRASKPMVSLSEAVRTLLEEALR